MASPKQLLFSSGSNGAVELSGRLSHSRIHHAMPTGDCRDEDISRTKIKQLHFIATAILAMDS